MIIIPQRVWGKFEGRKDLKKNENEQTQKEIAKQLHISRSYVSRIEKRALAKVLREFIKNNKSL